MRLLQSILGFALLSLVACGQGTGTQTPSNSDGAAKRPLQISTVNYPLAWAAQQLAGEGAEVHFPAPADVDPAFWQPDLDTVAAYQQADLILLNGANYARWRARVTLPDNRLVDTSSAFTDQLISVDSSPVHTHGPDGDHSHGELAFTVWLDLSLYAQQLQSIAAALAVLLPERARGIAAGSERLSGQLMAMDSELIKLGQQLDGEPVLYSHPVYQYFGRRYRLNGRALHWEPDQSPSERDWSALGELLKQHPATLMIWEDKPLAATRDRLTQLGVEVVVFRPLGNRPPHADFESAMSANIARLRAAAVEVP